MHKRFESNENGSWDTWIDLNVDLCDWFVKTSRISQFQQIKKNSSSNEKVKKSFTKLQTKCFWCTYACACESGGCCPFIGRRYECTSVLKRYTYIYIFCELWFLFSSLVVYASLVLSGCTYRILWTKTINAETKQKCVWNDERSRLRTINAIIRSQLANIVIGNRHAIHWSNELKVVDCRLRIFEIYDKLKIVNKNEEINIGKKVKEHKQRG